MDSWTISIHIPELLIVAYSNLTKSDKNNVEHPNKSKMLGHYQF